MLYRCPQALLHRGDIALPASVILNGEHIASEFCSRCRGSSGSSLAPWPCSATLLRGSSSGQSLPPGFAWPCLPTVQREGED